MMNQNTLKKQSFFTFFMLLLTLPVFAQYGISFNGNNNSQVDLSSGKVSATSLNMPEQAITVETWVYPEGNQVDYTGFISFVQDNGSTEAGWALGMRSNNNAYFALKSVNNTGIEYLESPNPIPLNAWTHVAGTYDGTTVKLYVDGVEVASHTNQSGDIYYLDTWFQMGNFVDDNEELHLVGKLDELRIWNTARTASEILSNKDKELADTAPTYAYYKMNCPTDAGKDFTGSHDGILQPGASSGTGKELTKFAKVCNGGNPIILSNQQAVDDFSTTYCDCNYVNDILIEGADVTSLNGLMQLDSVSGDLVIQYSASLTTLSGLANVTSVGADLVIRGNASLASLSGLDNVNFVGDALDIDGNASLTSISGLANLTSVGGDLAITSNAALPSISGFGNVSSVGGNLRISHNDALTSISGFGNVTSVGGNFLISHNDALTSISGLENITSFEGDLAITSNAALPTISGFGNVTSIGGELAIRSNTALTSLSGLAKLTSIGGGMGISLNTSLTSISGLASLTSVGGGMSISGNVSLTSIFSLASVTSVGGGIGISINTSLTSLSGSENITSILGDLVISSNAALTSISGLANVTSVGGRVLIEGTTALTSLSGLDNVTSIGGNLEIWGNASMTSISGLGNVTSVGGNLHIYSNASLLSISGLGNVSSVGGSLEIKDNAALTSLSGFGNVTSIGGDLIISENASLPSISGLGNVSSVGGYLSIYSNASLTSISGLENVTSIVSSLEIHSNASLTSISGFSSVLSLDGGNLEIYSNASLTSISGLANVTSVEGSLEIRSNAALTNLSDLANVTSIGGDLNITNNAALTSISGLENLTSIGWDLKIEDNPALSLCSTQFICEFLSGNGTSTIQNNATGCATVTEVNNACNCDNTNALPTTAGTYNSSRSVTDANGWTNYCSIDGKLLLSLDIGSSGAVVKHNEVSLKIGNTTTEWHPSSTGFVTNPDGTVTLNRSWDVQPTTQPTSNIGVRHYFTDAEYQAVNTEINVQGQTPLIAPNQMWFYKQDVGPHAEIANIPTAEIIINGSTSSTTEWVLGAKDTDHYAEFMVSSFSGGGGGGSNGGSSPIGAVLPVELLDFRAKYQDQKVYLTWQTATEINNAGFEVQHSLNSSDWQTIDWKTGAGTSFNENSYESIDRQPATGTNYYRLKQIDFDGKFEYSDIEAVQFNNNQNTFIQVFPNPTNDGALTVRLEELEGAKIQIQVYDLMGRIWLQQTAFEPTTVLNVHDLAAGMYWVEIAANGQVMREQISVQ